MADYEQMSMELEQGRLGESMGIEPFEFFDGEEVELTFDIADDESAEVVDELYEDVMAEVRQTAIAGIQQFVIAVAALPREVVDMESYAELCNRFLFAMSLAVLDISKVFDVYVIPVEEIDEAAAIEMGCFTTALSKAMGKAMTQIAQLSLRTGVNIEFEDWGDPVADDIE